MKRKIGMGIVAMSACAIPFAALCGEEDAGKLDEFAPQIQALLKLRWREGGLELDQEHWKKPFAGKTPAQLVEENWSWLKGRGFVNGETADPAFIAELPAGTVEDLAEKVRGIPKVELLFARCAPPNSRGGGGINRARDSTKMHKETRGKGLAAVLDYKQIEIASDLKILFREEEGPGRSVEIADGPGGFRLELLIPKRDWKLLYRQEPGQSFTLSFQEGARTVSGEGGAFLAWCARHREFLEQDLLPALQAFHILSPWPTPWTLEDPGVVQAACDLLRHPLTAEENRQAAQGLNDLSDASPKMREKATGELSGNFARFRRLLNQEIRRADPSLPSERKARVEQIVDKQTGEGPDDFAAASGILDDPACLIRLLGRAQNDDRKPIAAELERLTGQRK